MPAGQSLTRQPVHRQWWRMYEALVDTLDSERRKVLGDPTPVVHRRVGIARAVGVVMNELGHAQVAEQSRVPRVVEVIGQHRARTAVPWGRPPGTPRRGWLADPEAGQWVGEQ